MAATDVVTASALQLMSMAEKGKEEGVLVATVTVPVNATDGEVRMPLFACLCVCVLWVWDKRGERESRTQIV